MSIMCDRQRIEAISVRIITGYSQKINNNETATALEPRKTRSFVYNFFAGSLPGVERNRADGL